MHNLGTFKKSPSPLSFYPSMARDLSLVLIACAVFAIAIYAGGRGLERQYRAHEIAGRV